MEYRKIQLTGDSTYIVSLPKTWVKKNNLDKGDIVYVMEKGAELVIKQKEEKEKEVDVKIKTTDMEFLSRILITKYIQGFDSIVFTSKDSLDSKIRAHLIKTSQYLIGLEPFGETKDGITFKMVMKGGRSILESVERMHDMSILSLRELMENLEEENYDENVMNGIIQRDNEIDKFYFLILRQLSASGGYESIAWVQIAKSIERVSDHVEHIANYVKEGKKVRKEDISYFKHIIDLYGDAMLTIKTGDLSMAEEILLKMEKQKTKDRDFMEKASQSATKNILIYASLRRIGEYISDIAESVINLS
jgi:phosphate uptake regulator